MSETLILKELDIDGVKKRVLCCSYSQIDVFSFCKYQWFLSYLKGLRKHDKAEALDLGSAIHITLQDYYNALKGGKEWTLGEAIDNLEFNMDSQDIKFADEEREEVAKRQHLDMITKLVNGESKLSNLIKGCEIIACELEFKFKIDLPFKVRYGDEEYDCLYLLGAIDLIVKDKNGDLIIVDYKTGKKIFEPKKIKTNLQLPIYALIVFQLYGRLPKKTLYYFTRLDEIQEVEVPALSKETAEIVYFKNGNIKSVQRTIEDIMTELIEIFRQMYTIGEYKPNGTTPLCCWCQYHHRYGNDTCKFGNETYWRNDIDPFRY